MQYTDNIKEFCLTHVMAETYLVGITIKILM